MSTAADGLALIWDSTTGRSLATLEPLTRPGFWWTDFSPDGSTFFTDGGENLVQVFPGTLEGYFGVASRLLHNQPEYSRVRALRAPFLTQGPFDLRLPAALDPPSEEFSRRPGPETSGRRGRRRVVGPLVRRAPGSLDHISAPACPLGNSPRGAWPRPADLGSTTRPDLRFGELSLPSMLEKPLFASILATLAWIGVWCQPIVIAMLRSIPRRISLAIPPKAESVR